MPRYATLAEQYRAHRAEMELALELGITPVAARRILRARESSRRAACGTRAPAAAHDHSHETTTAAPAATFGEWDAPWMMRD